MRVLNNDLEIVLAVADTDENVFVIERTTVVVVVEVALTSLVNGLVKDDAVVEIAEMNFPIARDPTVESVVEVDCKVLMIDRTTVLAVVLVELRVLK